MKSIDEMTIGEFKQLKALFSNEGKRSSDSAIFSDLIGKYVLVRSRNEGVNAGFVEKADETGIVLKEARRLWYHKPADKKTCWYEGIANTGLSSDSKVSVPVSSKTIIEDYSATVCADTARKSIEKAPSHEQS